jgi:hypothetical protein
MSFIIKRDTLIILQIFILIIIGFIIKDKFFNNKNKIEHFSTTNLNETDYNNNIIIYYKNITDFVWNDNQFPKYKENTDYKILDKSIIANEVYTNEDLIQKAIKTTMIRSISFPDSLEKKYIILYKDKNNKINRTQNAYVTNMSKRLDNEFSTKIQSISVYNNVQEYTDFINNKAKQENKIFLFTEPNYLGEIIAINIPSKSQENYTKLKGDVQVTIKSIIIPHENNINLDLGGDHKKIQENRLTTTVQSNQYKITAIENNIDTLAPLSVVIKNIEHLNLVKDKFEKIKDTNNENQSEKVNDYNNLVDNYIDDLYKNIENHQNKINYKVNQFGNYY